MSAWWKDAVVYQIYPRSFQDSNADGIGDLPGILSRLDYLRELGVDVLWLSPVYRSPNDDNGYDISDYCDINPEFGTMQDMDELIAEAGKRGIRILMDLVINHTSDEHEWFLKSKDKTSPYRHYYYWREGKNGGPPNNWTSFFAGGAWEKDEASGDYYLHLFSKKQPDLDYHNPAVIDEIKKIMRFWLDKGVAGFRCDVINILWKSSLENGRKRLILTGSEHYISQEGLHPLLRRLRAEVLLDYDVFTVGETVFVTPAMAKDLCGEDRGELDMVFSFEHMECDQIFVKWFKTKFRPERLFRTLAKWQQALSWNALYFENHDQPRSVSRFGGGAGFEEKSAKLLAMLLLGLRGTPYIYQGQELGMTNFDYTSMDDIADVESKNIYKMAKGLGFPRNVRWNMIRRTGRDNARTPMQWDGTAQAGFTASDKPWLKVNANHTRINAEAEKADADSVLSFYKRLLALRKELVVLRQGSFQPIRIDRRLFVFERDLIRCESDSRETRVCGSGPERVLVLINLSKNPARFPCRGQVLFSNCGRSEYDGSLSACEALYLTPEIERMPS